MKFTKDTKLRDINDAPELSPAKGHLISGGDFFAGENGELTLSELQEKNPSTNRLCICLGNELEYPAWNCNYDKRIRGRRPHGHRVPIR